jgi:hypothetical protein
MNFCGAPHARQLQNRIVFELCNISLSDIGFAPLLLLNVARVNCAGCCVANFTTRGPDKKILREFSFVEKCVLLLRVVQLLIQKIKMNGFKVVKL